MALAENQKRKEGSNVRKIFGRKEAPEKVFGRKQAEDVAARVEKVDMATFHACLIALEVENNVAQEVKTEVAALGADNFTARKVNQAITGADAEDDKTTKAEIDKITAERTRRKFKNETDIKANNSVIEGRFKRIVVLEKIADAFVAPSLPSKK